MGVSLVIEVPASSNQLVITAVKNAVARFGPQAVALARAGCPWLTGKFSRGFEYEVSAQGNVIQLELLNKVKYAQYVHAKGSGVLWFDVVRAGVYRQLLPQIKVAASRAMHDTMLEGWKASKAAAKQGRGR